MKDEALLTRRPRKFRPSSGTPRSRRHCVTPTWAWARHGAAGETAHPSPAFIGRHSARGDGDGSAARAEALEDTLKRALKPEGPVH